jgi:photosystem II stability/assembly factor-like uncharacterized protein
VAVAGHPTDRRVFYFGACAGGIWKTSDGGTFWECISDGFLNAAAVGAIAVSHSDPNVLYAGTGETTIRNDVSHGDGVYRSTDGGKTWRNMGLPHTRHIAKIRVHPANPDIVYVAALGHAWGPNQERGLYRSKDGGATWEKILFRSERAGAIDLSMDPNNPRILFCAFWEAGRTAHSLSSGGEGSSIFKSTDGGDSWIEITRNPGLPSGVLGKIGIAVSPANGDRVWVLIEADDGALFRSDNGGETWQRLCDSPDLRRRAWYYMHLFADPRDANTCWVLNLQAWKSIDGGQTFTAVPTPHGDTHDLWIDPRDSNRLVQGDDGGACVSYNGGHSWSSILNQPTAQLYHVVADNDVPYRVYGSQQDNSAISIPSQSVHGAITEREWFEPGGGESGYIAVRPDDSNVRYAGDHRGRITRQDGRTGQQRVVDVWPEIGGMYEGAESLRYRFNWTFPLFTSPHDPDVLYAAANRLFRSRDEGGSWEVISPDLTRADPETLGPSGGPITRDNTSAETYATIFAAVESPHEAGVFWTGSDDGLVHISRDGGKNWTDVTPPELPEWALISIVEPSPHEPKSAYLAATRYKLDDTRPYLYKTTDYGQTWTAINNGIPETEFTRVIREDPGRKGLLFAGTETGLYLSLDHGDRWERFESNLPVCPIYDLVIKDDDLVVATHGRSFWILDDISPLRQLAEDRARGHCLFTPADTIRFKVYEGFGGGEGGTQVLYRMAGPVTFAFRQEEKPDGTKQKRLLNAGTGRPNGVILTYNLPEKPQGDITLVLSSEDGTEVRRFSSKQDEGAKPEETSEPKTEPAVVGETQEGAEGVAVAADPEADVEEQEPFLPKEQGINRFVWNFRAENATRIPGNKFSEYASAGPVVPTGRYSARLEVGGESFEASFQILPDPRVEVTRSDLDAQYELGVKLRDTMSGIYEAILEIRDVREQVEAWSKRLGRSNGGGEAGTEATTLIEKLTSIEEELTNTKATGRMPYPPPNVPTRLDQKLAFLAGVVSSADAAPTRQSYEVFEVLSKEVDLQLGRLGEVLGKDVPAFAERLRSLDMPVVVVGRK